MMLRLPRIDPERFARGFSKTLAKRAIEEKLYPILEGVGGERIRWLIENDQALYTRFPDTLYEGAKGYSWMLKSFSHQDFISFLPDWLVKLCQSYGEKGKEWMNREVNGIRKLLGGEP